MLQVLRVTQETLAQQQLDYLAHLAKMDFQVFQAPQGCLVRHVPYTHRKPYLMENQENQEPQAQEVLQDPLVQEGRKGKEEIVRVKEESQDLA